MSKSRLTTGVYVFTAACLLATWGYSQAPAAKKSSPSSENPPRNVTIESADDSGASSPAAASKQAKSSRIMFEANWKNVQVSRKPMYFRQGDKSFVWTVKNIGDNPVDVGDDYGFSIAPGEENFIVDTRLMLSVAGEKTTTVEVQASRVMTQGELTQESQPTKAVGPGSPYQPGVPTFGPSATYSPNDPFTPATPTGGREL